MRIILDTNVVVSGICFPKSVCGQIISSGAKDRELVWSNSLVAEVFRVLSRSKLDRFAPLEYRLAAARLLVSSARTITLGEVARRCRDAKDDHILQLAIDGLAGSLGPQHACRHKHRNSCRVFVHRSMISCTEVTSARFGQSNFNSRANELRL